MKRVHFIIQRHVARKPIWLLEVLALFPYDRTQNYPATSRDSMLEVVMRNLAEHKYKRRNEMQCLGLTHSIQRTDDSITIKSVNDVPYLTISLVE